MKILLFSLNASRSHTNLAIRILKERLHQAGYADVTLLEATEKDKRFETLAALAEADADLYGFSTYIWNVTAHLTLAENLKKLRPSAKIVFGGPEVSYQAEAFLQAHPFIDTVLCGEGEETVVSLVKMLENGEKAPQILSGRPYPDFTNDPVPYRKDEVRRGNILYYESTRGCPYRCAYCLSAAEEHKAIRSKSADTTLSELLSFEALEDVKIVKFVDRTFNYDLKRAKTIWQALLSERFTKQYHFEISGSLLDEEAFSVLKKFPKDKIQLEIGVQSTDPHVLAAIHRRDDTAAVLHHLERLMALGNLHIHADLIAGLPGDSFDAIGKSFDMLFGKCHMLQLGFLKLLKGSPLYAMREAFGYRFHEEPPYEVLCSDTLSFEELVRLKRMEEVLERFVNSRRFMRAVAVLTKDRSPFGVLSALSEYLPNPTTLSQRDAYVKLLDFERDFGKGDPRVPSLTDALALDFLLNEQGRIPAAIPHAHEIPTPEQKRALANAYPELYLPFVECYRFPTLGRIAVDRKHKKVYGIDSLWS